MRIRKSILAMAGIAMLTVITYEVYANCIGCPPPGEEVNCATNAQPSLRLNDGSEVTVPSQGMAHFTVVESHQGAGAFNTLRLTGFQGSGEAPGFGTFTWMGDPDRTTELSRVVSNAADGGFPGTSDIYMHMNVTLSWQPGKVFRSMTPIHVRSTKLMSWAPQRQERYRLVSRVQFLDPETGEIAFTLTDLPCVLN